MTEQLEVVKWGFAALSREKLKKITSQGGRAAHAHHQAHEFTTAEAIEAGRKGGLASGASRRRRIHEKSCEIAEMIVELRNQKLEF
jgi:general stress protein YciG